MGEKIKNIPLVLPKLKAGSLDVTGWVFTVRIFNIEGKVPYLVYRYENPKNDKQYIFSSRRTIDELIEYLKEFKVY